jgi:DNA-directed RNA polymerase specialized sigma24 family protein
LTYPYPSGVTEKSFLAAVNHIAGVLSAKFQFGPHDKDDIAQIVSLHALEALPRFDPAKGNLEGFLYRHCSHRLCNMRRDETGSRTDTPCKTCFEHALGAGDGHPDGSVCQDFVVWWNRRQTRGRLARPVGIDNVFVEGESRMKADSIVESEAEMKELRSLIDAQLPIEFRADYLRLRAGLWASIPIPRRRAVRQKVAEILRAAGVELDEEPDEQDVGRPD